jgi:hypothetical protein
MIQLFGILCWAWQYCDWNFKDQLTFRDDDDE